MKYNWIGLDYGGDKSGHTAIAYEQDGTISFAQATKNKSADSWIEFWLHLHDFPQVFIDAPLSIPGGFYGIRGDYMFRKADREVKAMSPMFLGGFTARAVQLKHKLEAQGWLLFETYPAALERVLFGASTPKKGTVELERLEFISRKVGLEIDPPANRHQYDALCAWMSGWRQRNNEGKQYGRSDEGIIYV